MEDARTKAALDALADLFLTGTAPVSAVAPPGNGNGNGAISRGEASISGPRPIRLSPKLRAAQQQPITEEPAIQPAAPMVPVNTPADASHSVNDEPASASRIGPQLRLHRPESGSATAPPTSASRSAPLDLHIEVAFLGNLPGFGGPWLTQYAHHLAQRRGPVGIIHIDGGQLDVDLVTAGRPPLPQDIADPAAAAEHSLEAWAEKAPRQSLPALIDALIHRAPVAVATWLIHLPTNLTDATRPIARQLKRWTLICGADEMAVAAGHRLFRSLLENDPARDQRRLGSMIVGADEAKSFQSADRLRATASSACLGMIELVGWQKQMVPVNLTSLASFADPEGAWAKLWPAIQEQAGVDESLPPAESLASMEAAERKENQEAGGRTEAPDVSVADEPEENASARAADGSGWVEQGRELDDESLDKETDEPADLDDDPVEKPVASKPMRPAPRRPEPAAKTPARAAREAPAVAAHDPELASFIPGLVAMQARSPRHPATRLALDEDGVIHLMLHHATPPKSASGSGSGDALRAAVLELIETRAWVKEHHDLLAMTQRQMRFDAQAEPVLHLFTDDAKLAAALAARLGQFVRLHLLKRVTIGAASTWFSTEMN